MNQEPIQVGVLAAPGLPAELVGDLADELRVRPKPVAIECPGRP